jgi:hypothetical protein
MATKLIQKYWNVRNGERVHNEERGVCQCGTERLIESSRHPEEIRAFLLVGVFVDQLIYTHYGHLYAWFVERYRFPKLYAHGGGGMASPSWLVYTRYGYDQLMDWSTGQSVADEIVKATVEFIREAEGDNQIGKFLEYCHDEINAEFEDETAQCFKVVMTTAFGRAQERTPPNRRSD